MGQDKNEKKTGCVSGCGLTLAFLSLLVSVIALIPAFGQWFFPQEPKERDIVRPNIDSEPAQPTLSSDSELIPESAASQSQTRSEEEPSEVYRDPDSIDLEQNDFSESFNAVLEVSATNVSMQAFNFLTRNDFESYPYSVSINGEERDITIRPVANGMEDALLSTTGNMSESIWVPSGSVSIQLKSSPNEDSLRESNVLTFNIAEKEIIKVHCTSRLGNINCVRQFKASN